MRTRPLFLLGSASLGAALLAVLQACVGDDPVTSTPPQPDAAGHDGSSGVDAGGGSDAAAALRVEPARIELAPGATVSIKISGGTPGAAVTLTLANPQTPDGGAPASGVSFASSSAILSPTGEANVEIRASADATQHRFDVEVSSGAAPKVVPGVVIGKPGTLDAFFGDRGGFFDFFTADTGDTTANSVIVQPDGKFVVGGTGKAYQELLVARFTADGVLDTSFATKGFVLIPGARTPRMALFSDGSIVIAAAAPNDPKLFRLTASGAFAPGWGNAAGIDPGLTHGTLDPAFAETNDTALVAGRMMGGDGGVAVKKYLADAGLDPSFGSGGVAAFNIGFGANSGLDRPFALAVDPTNGDIWASGQYYPGSSPDKSWVRRLSATGAVQPLLINDTANGAASAMVMQDLKPIVAAYDYGTNDDGLYLFRMSGTGLDTTFGTTDGETRLSSQRGAAASSIAVDSEKRIYVANSSVSIVATFDVYRTTAAGVIDTTFADSGKFSMQGRAYGVAVAGRQLLVVGVDDGTDQRRARIARLWL